MCLSNNQHNNMAHKALDVANVILKLSNPEVGDFISNLKLQKLLYYTQGFSLVILQQPIFEEDIKAWDYGPVVENVYHAFKGNGSEAICPNEEFDTSFLSEKELELLINVYEVYGQFSALKLMNMTHEEAPWKNTPRNGVISRDLMVSFFRNLVDEEN